MAGRPERRRGNYVLPEMDNPRFRAKPRSFAPEPDFTGTASTKPLSHWFGVCPRSLPRAGPRGHRLCASAGAQGEPRRPRQRQRQCTGAALGNPAFAMRWRGGRRVIGWGRPTCPASSPLREPDRGKPGSRPRRMPSDGLAPCEERPRGRRTADPSVFRLSGWDHRFPLNP